MELVGRMVLAEAEVCIVCCGLVGVVVAVLMGVNNQRTIQVGLHVWAGVTCEVHLQGEDGKAT